jgi:hypothetical protein
MSRVAVLSDNRTIGIHNKRGTTHSGRFLNAGFGRFIVSYRYLTCFMFSVFGSYV